MISNRKLKLIKRGIQEELCSTNSFIITDRYRYYTTIMYWWYLKYGSNSLSDYILADIADRWDKYFKTVYEEQTHDESSIEQKRLL